MGCDTAANNEQAGEPSINIRLEIELRPKNIFFWDVVRKKEYLTPPLPRPKSFPLLYILGESKVSAGAEIEEYKNYYEFF